jgi:hypothetical protein
MSELVTDISVPDLLSKLRSNEWQVPKFQREFVWNNAGIIELGRSVLESRPIGMVTVWQIEDDSSLHLEKLSLPDRCEDEHITYYGSETKIPNTRFAILDGRQRSTALALLFGGFQQTHGLFKFCGKYYLDVSTEDDSQRIIWKKQKEIIEQGLETDSICFGQGLFPLSSNVMGENLMTQWMRYLQAIGNPDNYQDSTLPCTEELGRRDKILKSAFEGIVSTRIAVYTVPNSYELAEICEIFEKLNMTGTRISTVDLLHSLLMSDTSNDAKGPFELRDSLHEWSEKEGAVGWISKDERPELTIQIVTACYAALKTKDKPVRRTGKGITNITSVKSSDMLAVPASHWRHIVENEEYLFTCLSDFQNAVAGDKFHSKQSPYPVMAAVYVALRWYRKFDAPEPAKWGITELDSLYRAFFWQNALTTRYDQGFLAKIGTDIRELKKILDTRDDYTSSSEWAKTAQVKLDKHMLTGRTLPNNDEIYEWLTDGTQSGAIGKALTLPILCGVKKDFINTDIKISFPNNNEADLHHIYPKAWCRDNITDEIKKTLDIENSGKNWVDSVANRIPLSRPSNNEWKAKNPQQYIEQKSLSFNNLRGILTKALIDEDCFNLLLKGADGMVQFWDKRAKLIAKFIIDQTKINL